MITQNIIFNIPIYCPIIMDCFKQKTMIKNIHNLDTHINIFSHNDIIDFIPFIILYKKWNMHITQWRIHEQDINENTISYIQTQHCIIMDWTTIKSSMHYDVIHTIIIPIINIKPLTGKHIFIFKNTHCLSHQGFMILRKVLERTHETTCVISTCITISNIPSFITSRFINIRLSVESPIDCIQKITKINNNLNRALNFNTIRDIYEKSNNGFIETLLQLDETTKKREYKHTLHNNINSCFKDMKTSKDVVKTAREWSAFFCKLYHNHQEVLLCLYNCIYNNYMHTQETHILPIHTYTFIHLMAHIDYLLTQQTHAMICYEYVLLNVLNIIKT